jgi:elongation factor Ts
MAVTAQLVKELREMTGAGMMDCKNVLVETDGDMDKAVVLLREKGLAKAAKKADRVAAQGLVKVSFADGGTSASIIEVNSETDFVAKNEEFLEFVGNLADLVLAKEFAGLEAFMEHAYDSEGSVKETLTNKIARIGENMNIRRFERFAEPGCVYTGYIHGGGTIGVIVGFKTDASFDEVVIMGKDVAMQVASMNPKFLRESDVDAEYIESEKQILTQQVLNEGKAPEMVEKIVTGKIKKEIKEVCLVEQKFVKDSEMTVKQYIDSVAKEVGKPIEIVSMIRYEVGEGIEKAEENFAEEVAKQMAAKA